jgi:GR25 family glycosyltransferase involved in LPS biosynthesis
MIFDRVYVVHLPHAARRKAIEAELAKLGMQATFLYADPPAKEFTVPNMRRNPAVEFALSLSHIKCVIRALDDGAERPLFLEDDVVFHDEQRLPEVAAELPADYDVLYLGGHPRGNVTWASKSLVRVSTFSFAEAYSLSRKALRPFLDFWLNRIGQPKAMYDIVLGEFAADHKGYCVYPLMTEQALVSSLISGKIENKESLLLRGWGQHLC